MSDIRNVIARVVAPLQDRIKLTIGRCVIRATDDSNKMHQVQMEALRGEIMSEVNQMLAYGYTSRVLPPDASGEAEGIFVCVGGARDHPVLVGTEDRRHRPVGQLLEGEVMIYDDQGTTIHLKRGKKLEITVANIDPDGELKVLAGTVNIDCDNADINAQDLVRVVAPLTKIEGDLEVTGSVTDLSDAQSETMASMRAAYNVHTHVENGGSGPTDQPNPQV